MEKTPSGRRFKEQREVSYRRKREKEADPMRYMQ
jgi:hypothetical protein